MGQNGCRAGRPVLVPDVHASGMLAVVRSLGRAGYPVHACASRRDAIGLYSKLACQSIVCPAYSSPEFLPWLRDYIVTNGIRAVVPSEGFYLAIRENYDEFESLLVVGANKEAVLTCLSKVDVVESFDSATEGAAVRDHLPAAFVVASDTLDDQILALEKARYPVFIKGDARHAIYGEEGFVAKADDVQTARTVLKNEMGEYGKLLVQEPAEGCKATVNLFTFEGRVLADSMCVATHENPHTGGLTTLRSTWWHQGMYEDALARIRHLGWEGVAMMEYKWNKQTEQFVFIEMNARYWAALHLDLFAGRDFPRIQLDAFFGDRVVPDVARLPSVTCRNTFPADFGYVVSRVRDKNVALAQKVLTMIEFILISFDPRVRNDYFFPGDRFVYFRQFAKFVRNLFR